MRELAELIVRDLMRVYQQNGLIDDAGMEQAVLLVERHLRIHEMEKQLQAIHRKLSPDYVS